MLASRGMVSSLVRIAAGLCTAVLAVVVMEACGLPADDCTVGSSRCAGDEVQVCTAHAGGFYGGGIDDIHHAHSSSPTWLGTSTCGFGLCVTSGSAPKKAFCALSARQSVACGTKDRACDGSTLLDCTDNFLVARTSCKTCNATGPKGCVGESGSECVKDADCAEALECDQTRVPASCGRRCSCANGGPCASCDIISQDTRGKAFTWICSSTRCVQKF